jgi:HPt (histidine-containing phosphotransfer) domain-containing protein
MQTGTAAARDYTCFNLLGALEFLGDRQGVQDLLPVLCATLAKEVPETAHLLAQGDFAEAAQRLHSLKGFVPVFCFAPVVEELARVERLCRGGANQAVVAGYAALVPALQCLGEEAAHYMAQPTAA